MVSAVRSRTPKDCLITDAASVRFKVDVNTGVRCQVVSLGSLGVAAGPFAFERECASRLATNVGGRDVLVQLLCAFENDCAIEPFALMNLLLNFWLMNDDSHGGLQRCRGADVSIFRVSETSISGDILCVRSAGGCRSRKCSALGQPA